MRASLLRARARERPRRHLWWSVPRPRRPPPWLFPRLRRPPPRFAARRARWRNAATVKHREALVSTRQSLLRSTMTTSPRQRTALTRPASWASFATSSSPQKTCEPSISCREHPVFFLAPFSPSLFGSARAARHVLQLEGTGNGRVLS